MLAEGVWGEIVAERAAAIMAENPEWVAQKSAEIRDGLTRDGKLVDIERQAKEKALAELGEQILREEKSRIGTEISNVVPDISECTEETKRLADSASTSGLSPELLEKRAQQVTQRRQARRTLRLPPPRYGRSNPHF